MRTFESMDEFKEYADRMARRYVFKITSYNEGYSIDVAGSVDLYNRNLTDGFPIKFNKITGDFLCYYNQLTSLEGCPKYVGCHFNCSCNQYLTSLEGCPEYVGGDFKCNHNRLISLKGCPEIINGNFYCDNNRLKNLKGSPVYVKEDYVCHNNYLVSLKGCPKYIDKGFYCQSNSSLKNLKGAPEIIRGEWHINDKFHSYPEYQKYLLVKKIEKL